MSTRPTRPPTGLPNWPITLLAGVWKSGMTWAAAEATASDLVGGAYWIGVGEEDPDEYALIPGAGWLFVQHDGTWRDILEAVKWASDQPRVDGKPNLIVVDSMTPLWDLLCRMAQDELNDRRAKKRMATGGKMDWDLWTVAANRFGEFMEHLRNHDGPVIVTARLEEILLDAEDREPVERTWKIQSHKSLPAAVTVIVEMPTRGTAYLSGVKSFRLQLPERQKVDNFTVDSLWESMGLPDAEVGVRQFTATHLGAAEEPPIQGELIAEIKDLAGPAGVELGDIAQQWADSHSGQHIGVATSRPDLLAVRDRLKALAAAANASGAAGAAA